MTLNIDLYDRKILYELEKNCRQTNKQIAKKVRLSEQVVGNRIKKLVENKVIDYFYVKANPRVLDLMHIKVYLRLHNITKGKEKELLEELKKKKGFFWLASLRGKYDWVISIYVKNITDFSTRYEELFEEWGDYILDRNIIVLEKGSTFTKAYFVPKQNSEEIVYSGGGEIVTKLDDIDLELLRVLNDSARMSLINLAEKLKISADTVRYRMNNLRNKGVITGFATKINFEILGMTYHIISIKLQNMTKNKHAKLKTISKMNKNIIVYIKTIGDHDIEIETETSSKEELDVILRTLRDNFVNEIKDYDLLEVTKEHRLAFFPF